MLEKLRQGKVLRPALIRCVIVCLLAAVLLAHLFFVFSPSTPPTQDYFYVYVLDVGQSDAILLRCGERTALIDTGTATEEKKLRSALLRYGIERLDYLVLTHAHEDHVGNARWIVENLEVENVLFPAVASNDYAYRLLCQSATERSTTHTASVGYRFELGGVKLEVLLADGNAELSKSDGGNNSSVVLRAVFGMQSFLFMGDAEAEVEALLLATYDINVLDCDFLKVGHHGSSTSSTMEFLRAVTPTAAAISCGKQNTYGFPHESTLEGLTAIGAQIYRTDESGTLVFGTNGQELRTIPQRTRGLSL